MQALTSSDMRPIAQQTGLQNCKPPPAPPPLPSLFPSFPFCPAPSRHLASLLYGCTSRTSCTTEQAVTSCNKHPTGQQTNLQIHEPPPLSSPPTNLQLPPNLLETLYKAFLSVSKFSSTKHLLGNVCPCTLMNPHIPLRSLPPNPLTPPLS